MTLRGFTLIELVISLAIAAIVGVSLTMLLNQSYAAQKKVDSISYFYSRATLLFTQLERELMGAMVPIENILALEDKRKNKNNKNKETVGEVKIGTEKATPETEGQEKKKEDEPPYKAFERVFYCFQKSHTLFFSWISHDPLQLYWGSSIGVARPRVARIMYRLEQSPTDKTLFRLIRSEGFDLTYTPYEKHGEKNYIGDQLIDDVRSITITCVFLQEKKDEKAIPNKDAELEKSDTPPIFEVKKMDSWEWPQSEKDNQKSTEPSKQELPALPNGIHIKIVLWDAVTEKEVAFESAITIPAVPQLDHDQEKQKEKTTEGGAPVPDKFTGSPHNNLFNARAGAKI